MTSAIMVSRPLSEVRGCRRRACVYYSFLCVFNVYYSVYRRSAPSRQAMILKGAGLKEYCRETVLSKFLLPVTLSVASLPTALPGYGIAGQVGGII